MYRNIDEYLRQVCKILSVEISPKSNTQIIQIVKLVFGLTDWNVRDGDYVHDELLEEFSLVNATHFCKKAAWTLSINSYHSSCFHIFESFFYAS